MKKIYLITLLIITTFTSLLTTSYAAVPNNDRPTTFLGPIARANYTSSINDTSAYSLLGEFGGKNIRLGGTIGFLIDNNQRAKVSGEFLIQKIAYSFYSGNTNEWVKQGALGANYQYTFDDYCTDPQFDMGAFVSRAPSKGLSSVTSTFTNAVGVSSSSLISRRIAGSNAFGFDPGISLTPWDGATAGANLNYDNVSYDTRYIASQDAQGFGGTVHLTQAIADNAEIGLSAAVRQPFNNYQANLTMNTDSSVGTWIFGVDGAYTIGKNRLPTTYNAGVSVSYLVDRTSAMSMSDKATEKQFLTWVSKPAVYMPQVLAIADQQSICTDIPTFTGTLGFGSPPSYLYPFSVTLSDNFHGNNLQYTINTTSPANDGTLVIVNGVFSNTNNILNFTNVTITATNECGSVTSNVFGANNGA